MFKKSVSLLLLAIMIYACSSDSVDSTITTDSSDNFDRGALLAHTADNIIIPAFEDFNTKLILLEAATDAFTTTPNTTTLEGIRSNWLTAYKAWQHVEMFKIGKAQEFGGLDFGFVDHFNIYPVTVNDIETSVANGGYDLDDTNLRDAQGFPALDYLLHGVGVDDTAILENIQPMQTPLITNNTF